MQNYIITGGPGSGKSTLLQALERVKFTCYEETSRQVIREEVLLRSECLPWKNLACFGQKVLQRMEEQLILQAEQQSAVAFFDRGIPDIIAYLKFGGMPVEEIYMQVLKKYTYHSKVFLLPPWEEIYLNDPERWQTFEEAKELYAYIKSTYLSLGFNLLVLPKAPVAERVAFVLAATKA